MSRRTVKLDHQPTIPEVVEMAHTATPFTGGWWFGYLTRGGTYIVASKGFQFDDGRDRDSVAITAWGQVLPLSATIPPVIVAEFQRAIDAMKAGDLS